MTVVGQTGVSPALLLAVAGHQLVSNEQPHADLIFPETFIEIQEQGLLKDCLTREAIDALCAVPLVSKGVSLGKLVIFLKKRPEFTVEDKALVQTIAMLLGFAVDRLRSEAKNKKAAEELHGSEDRFRLMIEHAPVMIWLSDHHGACLYLSKMLRDFWGVNEDQVSNFDWRTTMHPDDMPEIVDGMKSALANKTSITIEGRYRDSKDEYRILQTDARPRLSASGELLGMIGVNVDVTEHNEAHSLRREISEAERFRILVEAITDYAVFLLGPEGKVASWNTGAQRSMGYLSSEIIGLNFSVFYTPEDQGANLPTTALATAASAGKFETQGWRVRKDGTRFWTNVVIEPIRNPVGVLIGFAKITRDLTEIRQAEQTLKDMQNALFQAQKLEAIGQLTGGIAHDFNNLLMVIQSSMELLRKRMPQDARLLSLVDNATEGVKRGKSLTERMLSFARRQDLDQKPIELHKLVNDNIQLLRRLLGPSVPITSHLPTNLSKVLADSNQLESAIVNLAVNARDAMPMGGSITITGLEKIIYAGNDLHLKLGKYVCLAIQDEGEGMPADVVMRATEPFFTTKGVGKGTGLGLSMVQGFAEQSGGCLKLKSKVGIGTTAELWLPVTDDADLPVTSKGQYVAQKSTYQQLVILVVDDDFLVRIGTTAMLEDLGHTVLEAGSGGEALALLSENLEIDLLITDQAMPQMTGTQLAQEVLKSNPDIPIILATGYAEIKDEFGASLPRLSKPFSQDNLAGMIREVLTKHS